jgi:hypothetical protein
MKLRLPMISAQSLTLIERVLVAGLGDEAATTIVNSYKGTKILDLPKLPQGLVFDIKENLEREIAARRKIHPTNNEIAQEIMTLALATRELDKLLPPPDRGIAVPPEQ